jgi:hypothetical protein
MGGAERHDRAVPPVRPRVHRADRGTVPARPAQAAAVHPHRADRLHRPVQSSRTSRSSRATDAMLRMTPWRWSCIRREATLPHRNVPWTRLVKGRQKTAKANVLVALGEIFAVPTRSQTCRTARPRWFNSHREGQPLGTSVNGDPGLDLSRRARGGRLAVCRLRVRRASADRRAPPRSTPVRRWCGDHRRCPRRSAPAPTR